MRPLQRTLFKDLSEDEIKRLLDAFKAKEAFFESGDIIFNEGDKVEKLGLLLEGKILITNSFQSGKEVDITTLQPGDIFGEVLLFADDNKAPNEVRAEKGTKVLFIEKENFLEILKKEEEVFSNFLRLFSNKVIMLSQKHRLMSMDQLRKKIASYLLSFNSHDFEVPLSREEMARYLGTARPSLSRELAELREEGYIDYFKNSFVILNPEALEELLQ